ncbi:hypothetical protein [Streptomyces sp. NPDC005732]|uniref:WXG100-like domain-containing protein n=1 Tax=Streptomyces sp. NPDC005732 TaxID=3157057 RepID=UPI00340CFFA5
MDGDLQMPDAVASVASFIVGQDWPKGSETGLRQLATAWNEGARQLQGLGGQLGASGSGVLDSVGGRIADEFRDFVSEMETLVPGLSESAGQMGDLSEQTALQVEYAKAMIITQAIIVFLQVLQFLLFGLPEAAAAELTAGRFVVSQLLKELLISIGTGIALNEVSDVLVQVGQFIAGHRHQWDKDATASAVASGAIGGAVGGLTFGVARQFKPRFAASLGGKLLLSAVVGGVTEGITYGIWGGDTSAFGTAVTSGFLGGLEGGHKFRFSKGYREGYIRLNDVPRAPSGLGAAITDAIASLGTGLTGLIEAGATAGAGAGVGAGAGRGTGAGARTGAGTGTGAGLPRAMTERSALGLNAVKTAGLPDAARAGNELTTARQYTSPATAGGTAARGDLRTASARTTEVEGWPGESFATRPVTSGALDTSGVITYGAKNQTAPTATPHTTAGTGIGPARTTASGPPATYTGTRVPDARTTAAFNRPTTGSDGPRTSAAAPGGSTAAPAPGTVRTSTGQPAQASGTPTTGKPATAAATTGDSGLADFRTVLRTPDATAGVPHDATTPRTPDTPPPPPGDGPAPRVLSPHDKRLALQTYSQLHGLFSGVPDPDRLGARIENSSVVVADQQLPSSPALAKVLVRIADHVREAGTTYTSGFESLLADAAHLVAGQERPGNSVALAQTTAQILLTGRKVGLRGGAGSHGDGPETPAAGPDAPPHAEPAAGPSTARRTSTDDGPATGSTTADQSRPDPGTDETLPEGPSSHPTRSDSSDTEPADPAPSPEPTAPEPPESPAHSETPPRPEPRPAAASGPAERTDPETPSPEDPPPAAQDPAEPTRSASRPAPQPQVSSLIQKLADSEAASSRSRYIDINPPPHVDVPELRKPYEGRSADEERSGSRSSRPRPGFSRQGPDSSRPPGLPRIDESAPSGPRPPVGASLPTDGSARAETLRRDSTHHEPSQDASPDIPDSTDGAEAHVEPPRSDSEPPVLLPRMRATDDAEADVEARVPVPEPVVSEAKAPSPLTVEPESPKVSHEPPPVIEAAPPHPSSEPPVRESEPEPTAPAPRVEKEAEPHVARLKESGPGRTGKEAVEPPPPAEAGPSGPRTADAHRAHGDVLVRSGPRPDAIERRHLAGVTIVGVDSTLTDGLRTRITNTMRPADADAPEVTQRLNTLLQTSHFIGRLPDMVNGWSFALHARGTVYDVRIDAAPGRWNLPSGENYTPGPPLLLPQDRREYERTAESTTQQDSTDRFIVATKVGLDLSDSYGLAVGDKTVPVAGGVKVLGSAYIARTSSGPTAKSVTKTALTGDATVKVSDFSLHVTIRRNGTLMPGGTNPLTGRVYASVLNQDTALASSAVRVHHPLEFTGIPELRDHAFSLLPTEQSPNSEAHGKIVEFLSPAHMIAHYDEARAGGMYSSRLTLTDGGHARLRLRIHEGDGSEQLGPVTHRKTVESSSGAKYLTGQIGIKQLFSANAGAGVQLKESSIFNLTVKGTLSATPTTLKESWLQSSVEESSSTTRTDTNDLLRTPVRYSVQVLRENQVPAPALTSRGHAIGLRAPAHAAVDTPQQDHRSGPSGHHGSASPAATPPQLSVVELRDPVRHTAFTEVDFGDVYGRVADVFDARLSGILPAPAGAERAFRSEAVENQQAIRAVVSPEGIRSHMQQLMGAAGVEIPLKSSHAADLPPGNYRLRVTVSPRGTPAHVGATQSSAKSVLTEKSTTEAKTLIEEKKGLEVGLGFGFSAQVANTQGASFGPSLSLGFAEAPVTVDATLDGLEVRREFEVTAPGDVYDVPMTLRFEILRDTPGEDIPGVPQVQGNVRVEVRSPMATPPIGQPLAAHAQLPAHHVVRHVSDLPSLRETIGTAVANGFQRAAEGFRQTDVRLERQIWTHFGLAQEPDFHQILRHHLQDGHLNALIGRSIRNRSWVSSLDEHLSPAPQGPAGRKLPRFGFSLRAGLRNFVRQNTAFEGDLHVTRASETGTITFRQRSLWANAGLSFDASNNAPVGTFQIRGGVKGTAGYQSDDVDIDKHTAAKTQEMTLTHATFRLYTADLDIEVAGRYTDEHGHVIFGAGQSAPRRTVHLLVPEEERQQTPAGTPEAAPVARRHDGPTDLPPIGNMMAEVHSTRELMDEVHHQSGSLDVARSFSDVLESDFLSANFHKLTTTGISTERVVSDRSARTIWELHLHGALDEIQDGGVHLGRSVTQKTAVTDSASNKNQGKTSLGAEAGLRAAGRPNVIVANTDMSSFTYGGGFAREIGTEGGDSQTVTFDTKGPAGVRHLTGNLAVTVTASKKGATGYSRLDRPPRTVPLGTVDLWAPRLTQGLGIASPEVDRRTAGATHPEPRADQSGVPLEEPAALLEARRTDLDRGYELVGFSEFDGLRQAIVDVTAGRGEDTRARAFGFLPRPQVPRVLTDTVTRWTIDTRLTEDNVLRIEQQLPVRLREVIRQSITPEALYTHFDELRSEAGYTIPGSAIKISLEPSGNAEPIGRVTAPQVKLSISRAEVLDKHTLDGVKRDANLALTGGFYEDSLGLAGGHMTKENLSFNSDRPVSKPPGVPTRALATRALPGAVAASAPDTATLSRPVELLRQPVRVTVRNASHRRVFDASIAYWVTTANDTDDAPAPPPAPHPPLALSATPSTHTLPPADAPLRDSRPAPAPREPELLLGFEGDPPGGSVNTIEDFVRELAARAARRRTNREGPLPVFVSALEDEMESRLGGIHRMIARTERESAARVWISTHTGRELDNRGSHLGAGEAFHFVPAPEDSSAPAPGRHFFRVAAPHSPLTPRSDTPPPPPKAPSASATQIGKRPDRSENGGRTEPSPRVTLASPAADALHTPRTPEQQALLERIAARLRSVQAPAAEGLSTDTHHAERPAAEAEAQVPPEVHQQARPHTQTETQAPAQARTEPEVGTRRPAGGRSATDPLPPRAPEFGGSRTPDGPLPTDTGRPTPRTDAHPAETGDRSGPAAATPRTDDGPVTVAMADTTDSMVNGLRTIIEAHLSRHLRNLSNAHGDGELTRQAVTEAALADPAIGHLHERLTMHHPRSQLTDLVDNWWRNAQTAQTAQAATGPGPQAGQATATHTGVGDHGRPIDRAALRALAAAGDFRLAGDLALQLHGVDVTRPGEIELHTSRGNDLGAATRRAADTLRNVEYRVAHTETALRAQPPGRTGGPATLRISHSDPEHTPTVIDGIPVVSLDDLVRGAVASATQGGRAEGLVRLGDVVAARGVEYVRSQVVPPSRGEDRERVLTALRQAIDGTPDSALEALGANHLRTRMNVHRLMVDPATMGGSRPTGPPAPAAPRDALAAMELSFAEQSVRVDPAADLALRGFAREVVRLTSSDDLDKVNVGIEAGGNGWATLRRKLGDVPALSTLAHRAADDRANLTGTRRAHQITERLVRHLTDELAATGASERAGSLAGRLAPSAPRSENPNPRTARVTLTKEGSDNSLHLQTPDGRVLDLRDPLSMRSFIDSWRRQGNLAPVRLMLHRLRTSGHVQELHQAQELLQRGGDAAHQKPLPKKLHMYWAGRRPTDEALANIDAWATKVRREGWSLHLWTSESFDEWPAGIREHLRRTVVVHADSAAVVARRGGEAAHALYEDMKAAGVHNISSDLVRYALFSDPDEGGGIYLDVDIAPGSTDLRSLDGLTMHSDDVPVFAPGLRTSESLARALKSAGLTGRIDDFDTQVHWASQYLYESGSLNTNAIVFPPESAFAQRALDGLVLRHANFMAAFRTQIGQDDVAPFRVPLIAMLKGSAGNISGPGLLQDRHYLPPGAEPLLAGYANDVLGVKYLHENGGTGTSLKPHETVILFEPRIVEWVGKLGMLTPESDNTLDRPAPPHAEHTHTGDTAHTGDDDSTGDDEGRVPASEEDGSPGAAPDPHDPRAAQPDAYDDFR